MAALFAGGFVHLVRSIDRPYYNPYDVTARAFAREFWPARSAAEVVCPLRDAGIRDSNWVNLNAAFYLCNQEIYTPRRQRHAGPDWNAISAEHPLRRAWSIRGRRSPARRSLRGKRRCLAPFTLRRIDDLPLTMLQPSTKVEHLRHLEFVPRAPEIARGTERPMRGVERPMRVVKISAVLDNADEGASVLEFVGARHVRVCGSAVIESQTGVVT